MVLLKYFWIYNFAQFCLLYKCILANIIKREYCWSQTFNPTCGSNKVIYIQEAYFGRMAIGDCVKIGDNLGCSSDVKSYLDSVCSGRQTCMLHVADINDNEQLTCLREMNPYLEAAYKCVDVYSPGIQHCTSSKSIEASTKKTFLSSIISKETSCGLHQTPYVITAKPGQIINITLHDFSIDTEKKNHNRICSNNYGYILDSKSDDVINICGGSNRIQNIYSSSSNQVQILLERELLSSKYFLIEFQAFGCAEIEPPRHAWIRKSNTTVTIGCESTNDEWTMKCIGNVWLGIMRTCPAPTEEPIVIIKEEELIEVTQDKNGLPDVTNNHLFAVAIGCITIIICCTTVVLGIHCVKRYELRLQKKQANKMNILAGNHNYNPVTMNTLPLLDLQNGEILSYTLNPQLKPGGTAEHLMGNGTVNQLNSINTDGLIDIGNARDVSDEIYDSIRGQINV